MTGVILIGGKSRRFGSDKIFASDGKNTLIERVKNTLSPVFEEIILIGHKRPGLEDNVHEDLKPGLGPLGGIYTALTYSNTDYCFIFAADMPNLDGNLIKYMTGLIKTGKDIIVPSWSKGFEPLHAIYNKKLLPVAGNLLDKGRLKIAGLYKNADVLEVPESEIRTYNNPEFIFSNINTPQDAINSL